MLINNNVPTNEDSSEIKNGINPYKDKNYYISLQKDSSETQNHIRHSAKDKQCYNTKSTRNWASCFI